MTIESFIEKAVEGGWKPRGQDLALGKRLVGGQEFVYKDSPSHSPFWMTDREILTYPEAWKAVVKMQTTEDCICGTYGPLHTKQCPHSIDEDRARYLTHAMIDALADGKTIEQYLETL